MPLSPSLATWLVGRGHDAVHALDVNLSTAPDEAILRRAREEGRVVVAAQPSATPTRWGAWNACSISFPRASCRDRSSSSSLVGFVAAGSRSEAGSDRAAGLRVAEPTTPLGRDNPRGAPLEYHVRLLEAYRDALDRHGLRPPPGYGPPGVGRAIFSVSAFMDVLPAEEGAAA